MIHFNRGNVGVLQAMLVVAMVIVYGQVAGHEFLTWDDYQHVAKNRLVNPPTWQGVAQAWREPYWGLYVPVSYTFYAAEAAVAQRPAEPWGPQSLRPGVFHLGNLALHVACVLLVFAILRQWLAKMETAGPVRPAAAFAGAMLFGLHPLQVESVAWISEARGLLCALFSLIAIHQYVSAADGEPRRPATVVRYAVVGAAMILALLAKPAAVAVPLILAAVELGLLGFRRGKAIFEPLAASQCPAKRLAKPQAAADALPQPQLIERPRMQAATRLAILTIPAIAIFLLTKSLQPDTALPEVPLGVRPLVAGDAATFYLSKLVMPWPLGPDYGRTPQWVLAQAATKFAWLVPLVLVAGLACLPSRRWWLTAAAIFFAWLLPVLGLVPFLYQAFSTVADRYVYLAMLGPAAALAFFLNRCRRVWVLGVWAAVLLSAGAISFHQTSYWQNTSKLFTHGLEVRPHSPVAQYHLGIALAEEGRYAEAIEHYRDALAERPEMPMLQLELGNSLLAVGKTQEALEAYRRAVTLEPAYLDARLNLATTLETLGNLPEARHQYVAVLAVEPDNVKAHYNLGNLALQEPGKLREAAAHFEAALRGDPRHAKALANLGLALLELGRAVEAVEHERAALAIDPDLVPARVHLGRALAALGQFDEALGELKAALELIPADSETARQIREIMRTCETGRR